MTSTPGTHHRTHRSVVAAPADVVYALIADADKWPAVFGPSIFLRYLDRSETDERFQIWAQAGGRVTSWTSHRALDRDRRTIRFRQEVSRPPVAAMSGCWRIGELADGRTEVVLDHEFAAVGDDPDAVRWIDRALDRNSADELAALRRIAELGHPAADVVFTFEDTVQLTGPPERAYEFIDRADRWPGLLPHVARVRLDEDPPGIQQMEMDTVTSDGSTHTTESVRVCLPGDSIAYKQTRPPATMLGHSGVWVFERSPEGHTSVTARHTVALDPVAVREVLGPDSTLADGRDHLRTLLGANSRRTLAGAATAASASGKRTGS